jgi:flagellar hook protein FlgE
MIQAMYSAVSGVQAHQTRLDAIGNNIANVNTVGYKASRVTFMDQLSQTLRGATQPQAGRGGVNALQVGLGVQVGAITTSQTQGALQQTGRPADLALQGNGFFQVGDGQNSYYTRDGSFTLDADGSLVSSSNGMTLRGWPADSNGVIDTSVPITPESNLRIPIGTMTAVKQTEKAVFAGNFDSNTAIGGSYSRTGEVFDSLGNSHTVTFRFERVAPVGTAAATWQFTTSVDGGAFSAPGGPDGGELNFDTSGNMIGATGTVTVTPSSAAAPFTITPDFDDITQLSGTTTSNFVSQDGFRFGTLQSFTVGGDGTITGVFSNGMNRDLGRLAVAQFSNPSGLDKVGGNLFRTSNNSGTAQVSPPGVSGAARVSAGFLEQSNVNLADEFTGMIVTQRGFQANTKIVTASDEILQDLLQMKR